MSHALFARFSHCRRGMLAAALLLAGAASFAAYPDRPITLVVPYPPGGAADTLGRIFARHMALQMPGSNFVVENKSGAGTVIGAGQVALAAPDGYTLLFTGNTTYTLNPALKSKLPYDPIKSFESLGVLGASPLVLIANPGAPFKTVKELVAYAKANPDKLSYASFGNGTTSHFAGEMFKSAAGLTMQHVPYKGSAPAMQDLIAGQVLLGFDTNVASVPQAEAGKIRPLALTGPRRLATLPGVPTLAESGFPGFEMTAWLGPVAPRGLPEAVRTTLVKALAAAMATPAMKADLEKAGLDTRYEPPSAYELRVNRELPAMRALAQKANITTD
jgi:tripartite-type tricarboxylate transporter receptor subunit TctC